uniref:Pre-rRNA-processing protein ESF2 n=2 Tax=Chaetomium globosum (strain ATCC 6205 / CBS 148.51 / DSM 1962 / NBRC 6347 / NRRL 1970) TaxID=306901 RepID=ESF2_CHAGB|nr:RecName: Full=Pre-rRNA-processing protein ESF2; AltName: Full=18S rRNA factor 2 [Chaetomium globosum CBS 148.51]
MSTDKRNQFLDAGDSEDDAGHGYDSEEDLQKGGRSAKRRRVDDDDSDAEDVSDQEEEHGEDGATNLREGTADSEAARDDEEIAEEGPKDDKADLPAELPGVSKPLAKKNLVASEAAIKKSGVVYLSRIPPFMKPAKLRSLLEPYGKINRIFLTPEDPTEHTRRVRNGGNKKRSFTEGWVEFVKKKDAKKVCDLLNAQTIGGKKSSWYHDDVWALKYLNGFKWHHLTEQISAENAERTSRIRAEVAKTTRENKEFVRNVERAKVINGIQSKAAAKRKKTDDSEEAAGSGEAVGKTEGESAQDKRRTFKQILLAKKRKHEEQPAHVLRVLSKIF